MNEDKLKTVLAALGTLLSHVEDTQNVTFTVDVRRGGEEPWSDVLFHYDGMDFTEGPLPETK